MRRRKQTKDKKGEKKKNGNSQASLFDICTINEPLMSTQEKKKKKDGRDKDPKRQTGFSKAPDGSQQFGERHTHTHTRYIRPVSIENDSTESGGQLIDKTCLSPQKLTFTICLQIPTSLPPPIFCPIFYSTFLAIVRKDNVYTWCWE